MFRTLADTNTHAVVFNPLLKTKDTGSGQCVRRQQQKPWFVLHVNPEL